MRERSEAEAETYKRIKKGGARVGNVAVVLPLLSPSLRLWSCCPTPAAVMVVLPLLLPLPLWWPPVALVVVDGAAVATIIWVGVTPLPSWSLLVVVGGGSPTAVVIVVTLSPLWWVGCLPLLSPPGTPTTVICGGVATAVAVVVGGQWLIIKGGGHTLISHWVPVKWGGGG